MSQSVTAQWIQDKVREMEDQRVVGLPGWCADPTDVFEMIDALETEAHEATANQVR